MKIRVVDDDKAIGLMISRVLELADYECDVRTSTRNLYTEAAWDGIDGLILDYQLKGETGMDLLIYLTTSGIPVRKVVLSGRNRLPPEVYEYADAVLLKPASIIELAEAVGGRFGS